MSNYQESAYRYCRGVLFDACAESVVIKRGGSTVLTTRAIIAAVKYEDIDQADGLAFANFVDVLVYGCNGYQPQAGDVVETAATGDAFVVKPISSNLWKYDDPYNLVMRFHAQRRAI